MSSFFGGPGGEGGPRKVKAEGRFSVLRDIYEDPLKWFVDIAWTIDQFFKARQVFQSIFA